MIDYCEHEMTEAEKDLEMILARCAKIQRDHEEYEREHERRLEFCMNLFLIACGVSFVAVLLDVLEMVTR